MADIPIEGYALLDAIAVGESGGDYTILYGGSHFTDFSAFPTWAGKDNSHAAGKYQFEPATWDFAAGQMHLTDFSPASQDLGAWWLAGHDYKAKSGDNSDLLVALQDGLLQKVATTLKSTWTSLDPSSLPERYKQALAARQVTPAPIPAPVPPIPMPADVITAALANLKGRRVPLAQELADLDAAIAALQKYA